MNTFEIVFEIEPPGDQAEHAIRESLDGMRSSRGGVELVTLDLDGNTGCEAAEFALDFLSGNGVAVLRVVDDLVTRSEIARRANVTRQAVTHWATGARREGSAFPSPFIVASTELWRWAEVSMFLAGEGMGQDEVSYLTRREVQHIEGEIARRLEPSPWRSLGTARVALTAGPAVAGQHRIAITGPVTVARGSRAQ